MRKKSKYILSILSGLLFMAAQPVWAAGPPEPSPFNNPLAVTMMVLMILLLIIIGILANILVGTADFKLKKKKKSKATLSAVILFLLMTLSPSLFAQDATAQTATTSASDTIGGLATSTFYILATVIFLELFIIIAMLINIKFLLKAEKDKVAAELEPEAVKKPTFNWWTKVNRFKPVEQEADIDLGHDYDGIRELDNRLPPWWLYGFYLTIIVGVIYLWRYHVAETGPSSKEEYETSVAKAELKIQEYLKLKGDAVDENTATVLTGAEDIAAGKKIYTTPGLCATCHGNDGSGMVAGQPGVGPNLIDDYWIHGGNIKDIFKTIKYGIDGKGMPEWKSKFSAKEIQQISSYIKSLHGSNPAQQKPPQGNPYKEEAAPAKPAVDTVAAKENKVAMN